MNKTRLFAFWWIFFLFLIQNALGLIMQQNTPSFILIGVLFYATLEGPFFGFILGAFAGIFLEMFGVGKMGYEILILSLVGTTAGLFAQTIFRESFFTQIFLPGVAAYGVILFNLLVAKAQFHESMSPSLLVDVFVLPTLFVTVIISPFVFQFLKRMT